MTRGRILVLELLAGGDIKTNFGDATVRVYPKVRLVPQSRRRSNENHNDRVYYEFTLPWCLTARIPAVGGSAAEGS